MREQIIFKTDLSLALSQERLSHQACGAGSRLSVQYLQASLHSATLASGALFTDLGSSQTVFQVYSHWAWARALRGGVGPIWGPVLALSELVALSSSLPHCLISLAGQPFLCIMYTWLYCSCSLEDTLALSIHFEGCKEALSPTRVDLGLLTLS